MKYWKKIIKGTVSVITACTMLAAPCIQPLGVFCTVKAEADSVQEPNAAANGEMNAMSDEEYKKFGLATNPPSEFYETDEPLEDYEPTYISELYVGYMNKSNSWTGEFKVMENTQEVSKDAFNLSRMDDTLIGDPFDFSKWYDRNKDSKEVQTSNSCAIDYDGDGTDEILNVTLYVAKKLSGDLKERSRMDVRLVDQDQETGEWKTLGDERNPLHYELADTKTPDPKFVDGIEADSSKAYAVVTAGDYDKDGKEEAAIYVPTREGTSYNPYVVVLKYSTEGGWHEIRRIYMTEISNLFYTSSKSNFSYKYEGRDVPIVSLATTGISGQDDLVITVSHPLRSVGDNGQCSIVSIHRWHNGGKAKEVAYYEALDYGIGQRMRFPSAIDGDVDGNGVQELILGGYKNTGWSKQTDVGTLDSGKNYIQLICWNENTRVYEKVWGQPKEVEARGGLKTNLEMMEPAALAAGALHTNSKREQVFLEGVVSSFSGEAATGSSEKKRLESGSFSTEYTVPLGGSHSAFISSAYAAKFSAAGGTAEQIIVLSGDHRSTNNDIIYYDIEWIWEDPTRTLTGEVTNNDYIDAKNEDDDGTFISICPLDVDEDAVKLEYQGKSYGWSDPVLYAVLQSPPYWSELQYNSESFGTGEVSYKISYGSGSGTEGEWGVGFGVHMGVSVLAGAGIAGNKAMMGVGIDLAAMAEYVGSYAREHKIEESYEVSAAAGEDYAVLMAVPIVVYQYKMWIPEHALTEEDIQNFKEVYKDDPQYYNKYKNYTAGDIIPGHWEDSNVTSTLEPSFSHMGLEEYNELAREYKKNGLREVTENMLADKTIGDPSTYPHSKEELKEPRNIDDNSLYIGKPTLVNIGEAETRFSYGIEDGSELKNGFELGVDVELSAIMEAEAELFTAVKTEAEAGTQFELEGGASWITTNSKGTEFSAVVKDLPKGTSADYQFSARMAVFIPQNLPTGDGHSNGVYVVGYVVEGIDEDTAPPKLPVDLRVFGVTEHSVILKWDASDYRSAKSYEVFIEDKTTKNPRSIGKTEDTYFIAENLEPSTEYNFAVKSYTDLGLSSSMSRWVRAYTKADSSSAPHFEEYPRNVVVNVPGDPGGHVLEARAVRGEGMEDAELMYQWQQYSRDSMTLDGVWNDISGATGNTYKLPDITQENVNGYPEQIHYRVVATQKKGSNVSSVVSKVATLFINQGGGEHTFHYTSTNLWMYQGNVYQAGEGDIFYAKTGTEGVQCHVEVYEEGNQSSKPSSGELFLALLQGGQESMRGPESFSGSSEMDMSLDGLSRGDYEISSIYPGGLSGGGNDKDYFLPSQSDPVHLHVVDTYRITYHLDGGDNDPANPSVVTNESPAVQISPAKKAGYGFAGYWYLDEACENPLPDNILDPDTLSGDIDLYAKWDPVYYSISYELNGGENHLDNPASYKIDDKNIELKDPTRLGYTFMGWYKDAGFTQGPVRYFSGETASDLTFYAKWELEEYPIIYILNGGMNHPDNPVLYTVDDGEITLHDPSYMGRTFQGWYEDGAFTQGPVRSFAASEAVEKTFYARWEEYPVPFEEDEEGAYEIGSYEDLTALAQMIQLDPVKYASADYIQTGNINCGEKGWALTIGTEDIPFQGTYEGNDQYILGLRQSGGEIGGLFGVIGSNGVVRDLSVIDLDCGSPMDIAGGLAGINRGTVIGCGSGVNLHSNATIFRDGEPVPISTLNSQVDGVSYAGGLVGRNQGTIQDSHSNASVAGKTAGGIAGENTGVIRNVYNTGTVEGEERTGGLVGENTADGSIRYGYNNKDITKGGMTGGIAGYSENANIAHLWYLSDTETACGSQEDGDLTVGQKSGGEMKTQEFCDTLNDAIAGEKEALDLRGWTWSESKNDGHPMLEYKVVQQQTLSNTKTGIQVSGNIHPGAQLELVGLSDGHGDIQVIKKSLRSGSYVKGWQLALKYADGTYATWEGKLSVTITSDLVDDIKDLRIVQVDEEGRFHEVETARDGKKMTVKADTLGSFSIIRTEPKTSQTLKNKYTSLKKRMGAASVTQTVRGAKTNVTFTSSDPKVATVSKKGKIRFKGVGTAYITSHAAEDEDYKAASLRCKVTVIPKTPKIKSLVSKKKGQVHIRSDKTAKGNTGYQIQYKIKGKKKVHSVRVKSRTVADKTIRGLKSGKKVRVRIRAYKVVKGKTYYGNYSKYKTVTVK